VRLSVDDFGTGYSSLAYLKQLPVDEVKIDRVFVRDLARDDQDAAIVASTVDLAGHLGLRVVAEGVEDEASWHRLRAMGCAQAQGWFVAKAMPADDVPAFLATWTAPAPQPAGAR
jgi:EAL domain-containing protein (putative c-di-GMP-specific phosphodiesterase class I)